MLFYNEMRYINLRSTYFTAYRWHHHANSRSYT